MSPSIPSQIGDPTWEIADWFPRQGFWTEHDYLELTESSNRLVELENGKLEVLTMPTLEHQLITIHLLVILREFVLANDLGMVLVAPHPTWLSKDNYREPDIVFKLRENLPAEGEKYFRGADMVIEVVSDDKQSHERDYVKKRAHYAEAGVAEYWIVDPQEQRVMVLTLDGDAYAEHANLTGSGTAASKLLDGFSVDVAAVFAAGKQR